MAADDQERAKDDPDPDGDGECRASRSALMPGILSPSPRHPEPTFRHPERVEGSPRDAATPLSMTD